MSKNRPTGHSFPTPGLRCLSWYNLSILSFLMASVFFNSQINYRKYKWLRVVLELHRNEFTKKQNQTKNRKTQMEFFCTTNNISWQFNLYIVHLRNNFYPKKKGSGFAIYITIKITSYDEISELLGQSKVMLNLTLSWRRELKVHPFFSPPNHLVSDFPVNTLPKVINAENTSLLDDPLENTQAQSYTRES